MDRLLRSPLIIITFPEILNLHFILIFKFINKCLILLFMDNLNIFSKNEISKLKESAVNCHVHLPKITEELTGSYSSQDHSLLPPHLLQEILPTLDPDHFFAHNPGMHCVLAVEDHNVLGRACPIYSPNDHVLGLARTYPERVIPFASIPMNEMDAGERIKDFQKRGFVGVKYHALEGYSLYECKEALHTLEDLSLPIIIHLGDTPFPKVNLQHADPRQLINIANEFPHLRMLITHFGTPRHLDAFWIASRYENVYMDTAEYPLYWTPHDDNPYGPLLSPLHTKRIGTHKILFGTDFPMPTMVRNPSSGEVEIKVHEISHYIEEFLALPDHYFSREEKRAILCENIWQFLGKNKSQIFTINHNLKYGGSS